MNGSSAPTPTAHKTTASVIIVGAGPVGLLIALGLGRAGIDTLVLEAHDKLLASIRAMVYMPVVLDPLRQLGILDKVTSTAYLNKDGIAWRDVQGNVLGQLPLGSGSGNFGGVLQIGQWRMNDLILEELKQYPCVEVRFGQRLVGIVDQPGSEQVKVTTSSSGSSEEKLSFTAQYVVGCDGANSGTRKAVQIPFEGFTYDEIKMIGTDVVYDFTEQENYTPLNFIVHEDDWAVIGYSGENEDRVPGSMDRPIWRVSFIEKADLPSAPDDYWDRAQERVRRYMVKGNASYRMTRAEPYVMQQRVAAQPRKGRVLLAGDALHSNNPIGGLGLTGGILDAFCYGNALVRVLNGKESEELLTTCAESRQQAWINVTNNLSQEGLNRLRDFSDDAVTRRKEFFDGLTKADFRSAFAKKQRELFQNMLGDDFKAVNEE